MYITSTSATIVVVLLVPSVVYGALPGNVNTGILVSSDKKMPVECDYEWIRDKPADLSHQDVPKVLCSYRLYRCTCECVFYRMDLSSV